MPRVIFREERCKGCGFCVEFCPKKILTLGDTMNNLGYQFVVMESIDKCTGCAICAMMCPEAIIEVKEA
ncbi:4Fe-4S dicluster domain-containing protein [Syntrophomonas erecta]